MNKRTLIRVGLFIVGGIAGYYAYSYWLKNKQQKAGVVTTK